MTYVDDILSPIGDIRPDEELAQEELKILEEANRIADEVEGSEEQIQEEIERIQKDNPNLVFEANPNLIGNGVQVSPELMEWATAHGVMSKFPRAKSKHTKKAITNAERVKKRKAQKKARKKNRR